MTSFLLRRSVLAGIGIVLAAGPAFSQTPPEELVVSTAWLASHLDDPNLVLLHVGEKPEYDAQHIRGARHVVPRDISKPPAEGALSLEMLPPEELRERLQALGISDNSRIVVYYGKDWVSPATRVIFTLDYAGLDRVGLLNGGMQAWIRDGHPATGEATLPRTGALKPLSLRPLVVDADFVRDHLSTPGFAVIDARAPALYDGTQTGGSKEHAHKTGHIAGALSVPFSSLTNEDLTLHTDAELTKTFASAGVKPGDTVITYCHIGQQATATLFAARMLGMRVLLYDGSFEDWSRRDYAVQKR